MALATTGALPMVALLATDHIAGKACTTAGAVSVAGQNQISLYSIDVTSK
ncbi:hypothetical protein GCM10007052_32870 [Halioglobus japonicus]|nr:hypothetical protein GCM10007052_32870 [Halioglobus japonicus]